MKFTKILVPLKGAPIDDQAVRLACQTARQSHARVVMIHIIQISRALPLEVENSAEIQRGEEVLEKAEKLARFILSLNRPGIRSVALGRLLPVPTVMSIAAAGPA